LCYRESIAGEIREGEDVEFVIASFQHANGVLHIEGDLI
jgi:hypothetical protein